MRCGISVVLLKTFLYCHFYRLQTKFAKIMCLHVSVGPQGGVPGQLHPPGRYTPWAGTPPWAGTSPWAGTPPQFMLGYGRQAGVTHSTVAFLLGYEWHIENSYSFLHTFHIGPRHSPRALRIKKGSCHKSQRCH